MNKKGLRQRTKTKEELRYIGSDKRLIIIILNKNNN